MSDWVESPKTILGLRIDSCHDAMLEGMSASTFRSPKAAIPLS